MENVYRIVEIHIFMIYRTKIAKNVIIHAYSVPVLLSINAQSAKQ